MKVCASCGASNEDDASFCSTCGHPLAATCVTCGAVLAEGARFCSRCGTPVAEETSSAPRSQERRVVTLLFADLVGSTAMGERLDPERLHALLDIYFAAMREEIEAEGGTLEKFIGDAIVAAFGAPTAHEDDPARALRAALRMRERLPAVNDQLRATFGETLEVRIGVNTGEVLATLEPVEGEPMFTGDAANTAARFEQAASPGQILASERTVRAARGFVVEDAGTLELKGKAEPARAFAIVRESDRAERGIPGLSAPMVGRDAELELLSSTLARVATERRPQLITIYGEPGVGKSRLVHEFLMAAGSDDETSTVVRGRCLPYGDGVTYWPLAEILKSVASVQDTDAPDVALRKVRSLGSSLLRAEPEAARVTTALAFTMGLEDPDSGLDRLDPKQVRAEIDLAWPRLFGALASRGPVLALVEDIHWADPALLDLLELLAEWVEGPVLFLCPARPELLAERPTWGGGKRNYTAIALDPLTADESEHLVHALLDIQDLPDAVQAQILERAGGNPFFIEEIVRQLVDGGMVVRDGDRWRARGDVGTVVIPDTVQAVLAARIDLLEAPSRRVLQAAAVVGRVFWPGAVSRLIDGNGTDLAPSLAPLRGRDLIRARPTSTMAGQDEYIFKHVLTRDVAYETLPRAERAGAHAAVGGWIEDTLGDRAGEFVELLAYHYVEAYRAGRESVSATVDIPALRARAFELCVQAARASEARLALHRAERFARQALDLADGPWERSLAAERLAAIYFDDYRGNDAWDAYELAVASALEAPDTDGIRLARLCALAAEIPTRWPGSMRQTPSLERVAEVLEIGLSGLPPGDSSERVKLLAIRASWPFAFPETEFEKDDLERYLADGLDAAEVALRLGLPDQASAAYDAASAGALAVGNFARAFSIEQRRLAIVDDMRDPLEIGDTYAMLSWDSVSIGDFAGGEAFAEEGLARVRTTAENASIHLMAWLVLARGYLGDWDGALRAFEEFVDRLGERRNDPPYFTTHAFAIVAGIKERRDEAAAADRFIDLLDRATAIPQSGPGALKSWAWSMPVKVARGQLDDVRDRLEHRARGWEAYANPFFEAAGAWVASSGSWDLAAGYVAEMRSFAEPNGCRPVAWAADLLEGRHRAAAGDPEGALSSFMQAREGFSAGGVQREAAVCDVEIAAVKGLAALSDEERERLDRAVELFERLRSVRDLDRVRGLRG